ncbi:MAG: YCF48-related protein, partial [Planctomycetaceae bacterium]
ACGLAGPLWAQGRYTRFTPERKSPFVKPTPTQDDANLHDVQFLGASTGWAVGDRGVIWNTANGGRTWRLLKSPVTCPLRSVCFLTDRIGWIAGGGTMPYTRLGYGVVLHTQDGGSTWRIVAGKGRQKQDRQKPGFLRKPGFSSGRRRSSAGLPAGAFGDSLPPLVFVKFFDLKRGVAVGDASDDVPSGVLVTADGGRSWNPVPGKPPPGWRAAAFLRPDVGVVAGLHGRMSLMGGGRMMKPAVDDLGLRGIRDIAFNRDETGWMVGDGGMVRKTDIGGVVWKAPPKRLPKAVRDIADFHAVATRGPKVWIAGSPGNVIWHSGNGGKSWTRQFTGQSVPIHALSFVSDRVGWAVGALGTMLVTTNGGKTWHRARGKNRRVAVMTIHGHRRNVSFPLLAKLSADLGYRSTVLLMARDDLGPDGPTEFRLDHRADDAVTTAGGSTAILNWRFPVALPGLDRDDKRLWADWNRRHEGRLRDVLIGSLVARLRTWKPTVVVLDPAAKDDGVTKLVNAAVLQAVKWAGDSTHLVRQAEVAGLEPWKVSRVYVRLADGSSGDATVSPHEYLPHRGEVNHMVATAAESLLQSPGRQTGKPQAYRLLVDRNPAKETARRDFFTGIVLWPGTDARRKLATIDESKLARRQKLAKRQRNFQAIGELIANDSRMGGQWIAQLGEVTAGMDGERAAVQLMKLADDYRRHSRWDLAEATWIEQVARYPDAHASLHAMRQLFHLWGGAETAWHRAKRVAVRRSRFSPDLSTLQHRLAKAVRITRLPAASRNVGDVDLGPDPAKFLTAPESAPLDRNAQRRGKGVRHWRDQALRMAAVIRKRDPDFYLSPDVQFPLAALLRSRGAHRATQRALQRFQHKTGGGTWKTTADSEMWMLAPRGTPPKPTVLCKRTQTRPTLDGVLSDSCWRDAKAVWLTPAKESGDALRELSFVLLAYDSEYLYLAGNCPQTIAPPGADAETSKRTRDADLSAFDRLGIRLDVDRDYATYYSLDVDQRGWTFDACWGDRSWNPKWHVAADRDAKSWRFEVAIPWKELVPTPPRRGTTWGVGFVRTVPAVGVQSWTHPVGKTPRPETFGLMRFD